ncbi:pentapeptide repeat-containing protein [Thalassiella azotivora]
MTGVTDAPGRGDLVARCEDCVALCCVVPGFTASDEFAVDKPPGTPCPHLLATHRCGIHATLRRRGFPGCTAYDCFGAGQHVTAHVLRGRDVLTDPAARTTATRALGPARDLHELLWYVTEALGLPGTAHLRSALRRQRSDVLALRDRLPDVDGADVDDLRGRVNAVLREAALAARADGGTPGPDRHGTHLVGADLRRTDLRRAGLRGALLLGADLRGADLTLTDLTGADLRGADLRGADLRRALFLTRTQVGGARGDQQTALPDWLPPPDHWR